MADYHKVYYFKVDQKSIRDLQKVSAGSAVGEVTYQLIINRILLTYIPKPSYPLCSIIIFDERGSHARQPVSFLLEHFMDTKIRIRKPTGRAYVNKKELTESDIITHNLFKLVRDSHRDLKFVICKLTTTKTNSSVVQLSFGGRRGRGAHVKQTLAESPPAYNLIKEGKRSEGELSVNAMDRSTMLDRTFVAMNIQEAKVLPSVLLKSDIFRLEMRDIQDLGPALTTSSSLMDLNQYVGSYLMRVDSSFFLLSMKLETPQWLARWRSKNTRTIDLETDGTWADALALKIELFNFTSLKYYQVETILIKDLLSTVSASKLESFYRAFVYERVTLWFYESMQRYLDLRVVVAKGAVFFKTSPQSLDDLYINKAKAYSSPTTYPQAYHIVEKATSGALIAKSNQAMLVPEQSQQEARYRRMVKFTGERSLMYLDLKLAGKSLRLKFRYFCSQQDEVILVNAYDTDTQENYKLAIRDPLSIERIVQAMDRQYHETDPHNEFISKAMNFTFDLQKQVKGRTIWMNDIYSRQVFLNRENSPEHVKFNIHCEYETVYISNYFNRKTLYFTTNTKTMGSVYVTCKLYYSFKLERNECIILLILSPMNSRFTYHKLTLNAVDLQVYFGANIFELIHSDKDILALLNRVVETELLVKGTVYSKLMIPLQKVRRLVPKNYTYYLQNEFDQRSLFRSSWSKTEARKQGNRLANGYLRQKIKYAEVVAKCVIRVNKQYWIVSVIKNLLLDRIDIVCYVPTVRRRFICSMSQSDVDGLSEDFKTRVVMLYRISEDKASETAHSQPKAAPAIKLSLKALNKHMMDLKFWLNVIRMSSIIRKGKDMLIKIDGFAGVLKELLWHNLCENDDLVFELSINFEPHLKRVSKDVQRFKSIPLEQLGDYSLLLKIVFVEKNLMRADKVALDELFKMYRLHLLEKIMHVNTFARATVQKKAEGQETETVVSEDTARGTNRLHQTRLSELRRNSSCRI